MTHDGNRKWSYLWPVAAFCGAGLYRHLLIQFEGLPGPVIQSSKRKHSVSVLTCVLSSEGIAYEPSGFVAGCLRLFCGPLPNCENRRANANPKNRAQLMMAGR